MIPRIYDLIKIAKGAANSSAASAASSNSSSTSSGAKGGSATQAPTTANATQAVTDGAKTTAVPNQATPTTRMNVKVGDKTYSTNVNGKVNLAQAKAMADKINMAYQQTRANTGTAQLNDSGPSYIIASAGKASDTYDVAAWNAAKADWRARRSAARKAGEQFTEAAPRIQSFRLKIPKAQQPQVTLPAKAVNDYKSELRQHLLNNNPTTSVPITTQGIAKAVGKNVTELTAQDYKNVGQHYNLNNLAYQDAQRAIAQDRLVDSIVQAGGAKGWLQSNEDYGPRTWDQYKFDVLQNAGVLPSTMRRDLNTPDLTGPNYTYTPQTYNSTPKDYGKHSDVLNQAIRDMRNSNNTYRDYNYRGVTIPEITNFTSAPAAAKGLSGPQLTGYNTYGGRQLAQDISPINLPKIPEWQPPAAVDAQFFPGTPNPYTPRITQLNNLRSNAPTPMQYHVWDKFFGNLSEADRQIINKNRQTYNTWNQGIGAQLANVLPAARQWHQQEQAWKAELANDAYLRNLEQQKRQEYDRLYNQAIRQQYQQQQSQQRFDPYDMTDYNRMPGY